MEGPRTQKELNNQVHQNKRHAEMLRRIDTLEEKLDLVVSLIQKKTK